MHIEHRSQFRAAHNWLRLWYLHHDDAAILHANVWRGDNSDYSSGTVVVWKAFGENLKEYCKKDISFEDIDKPFADRFTLYLQKQ
ncbi:MAG: phage integrase SAM-like domain-containing protein, partial [Prevotella sp.]|nr:phage integrase SAM-like domain-containing protein [Prevotella sp.]